MTAPVPQERAKVAARTDWPSMGCLVGGRAKLHTPVLYLEAQRLRDASQPLRSKGHSRHVPWVRLWRLGDFPDRTEPGRPPVLHGLHYS